MAMYVGCNYISQFGKNSDLLSKTSLYHIMAGVVSPTVGMIYDVAIPISSSCGSSNSDVVNANVTAQHRKATLIETAYGDLLLAAQKAP